MEDDGNNNLENTLSVVNSWIKSKLNCNLDKSKGVIFGEASQTEILDKFGLTVQPCVKYLGKLIDDDLSSKLKKTFVLQLHSCTHKASP